MSPFSKNGAALRFVGDIPASVEVLGKRGRSHDVVFQGNVTPGAIFTVYGLPSTRGGFDGTLGTGIFLIDTGVPSTRFRTSCSQPIRPGLISGNFEVISGHSRNAGVLCPVTITDASVKEPIARFNHAS